MTEVSSDYFEYPDEMPRYKLVAYEAGTAAEYVYHREEDEVTTTYDGDFHKALSSPTRFLRFRAVDREGNRVDSFVAGQHVVVVRQRGEEQLPEVAVTQRSKDDAAITAIAEHQRVLKIGRLEQLPGCDELVRLVEVGVECARNGYRRTEQPDEVRRTLSPFNVVRNILQVHHEAQRKLAAMGEGAIAATGHPM